MATPYDSLSGFMEENHEHKLESRKAQYLQQSRPGAPSQDLMSYWGYKFETLSLIPDQWHPTSREYIEGREDMVVNNFAQYVSIVKTGIGKARLVIGGEVDALWDCRPANKDAPINWVELKTSGEIKTPHDMTKYQRKLMKFWIQSFLLGVPKIIVGFRSQNGILQRLEELHTNDIPGMVKKTSRLWDGNLCINFTAGFLDCEKLKGLPSQSIGSLTLASGLKQTITGEGVWRIRRRERSPVIEVFKLEETGYGTILSREFVEWRTKKLEDSK
ncbi:MAG: hypothetical protein Q9217_001814 [Psora testacea]